MTVPVVGQIRSFQDAQRALERIRSYFLENTPVSQSSSSPTGSGGSSSSVVVAGSGEQWHSGAGAPTTLGNNNDWYFDIINKAIYQQRGGAWEYVCTIPDASGVVDFNTVAVLGTL